MSKPLKFTLIALGVLLIALMAVGVVSFVQAPSGPNM